MEKEDLAEAFDSVFDKATSTSSPEHESDDSGVHRTAWHLELDGEEVGPLSLGEIGRHIESGRVDPSTLVWRKGMSGWVRAGDVAEIDQLFVAPPIPERSKRTADALSSLVSAELSRPEAPAPALPALPLDAVPPAPTPVTLIPEPLPAYVAPVEAPSKTPLYVAFGVAGAAVMAAVVAAIVVVATHEKPRVGWKDGVAYVADPQGQWHPLTSVPPSKGENPVTTPAPSTPPAAPTPPPATALATAAPAPPATTTPAPATTATPAPAMTPAAPATAAATRHVTPPKPPKPPVAPVVVASSTPKPPCDILDPGCESASTATPPPPKSKEGLTPSQVLVVTREHLPGIRACASKYGGTGLARVGWRVIPNGNAVDVKILDAPLQGTQLGSCIQNAVASWKFPTAGKDTPVKSMPLPLR